MREFPVAVEASRSTLLSTLFVAASAAWSAEMSLGAADTSVRATLHAVEHVMARMMGWLIFPASRIPWATSGSGVRSLDTDPQQCGFRGQSLLAGAHRRVLAVRVLIQQADQSLGGSRNRHGFGDNLAVLKF